MKTLFNENEYFNEDYYERGAETGKSLYSHYRWMPELTIPMCHHIARYMNLGDDDKVLDFGCAKGFTVKGLRLLGYKAYGVDVSEYAISQIEEGTRKWCGVIKPQEPLVCAEGGYDWILCKDILDYLDKKVKQKFDAKKDCAGCVFTNNVNQLDDFIMGKLNRFAEFGEPLEHENFI